MKQHLKNHPFPGLALEPYPARTALHQSASQSLWRTSPPHQLSSASITWSSSHPTQRSSLGNSWLCSHPRQRHCARKASTRKALTASQACQYNPSISRHPSHPRKISRGRRVWRTCAARLLIWISKIACRNLWCLPKTTIALRQLSTKRLTQVCDVTRYIFIMSMSGLRVKCVGY